ncbi:uncharacterized protein [Rhodnius prolixus]|uniref:uncharacterized protein n=1 Tax=Rhodnius prolixus TaxID=13249 RepID=UPI003D18B46A
MDKKIKKWPLQEKKTTEKAKQNKSLKSTHLSNLLLHNCDQNTDRDSCQMNNNARGDNLKIAENSQLNSKSSALENSNQSEYRKASVASNQKQNQKSFSRKSKKLLEENTNCTNNIQNRNPTHVNERSSPNKSQKIMNFKITSNTNSLDPVSNRRKKKSIFQHNHMRRRRTRTNWTFELIWNMIKTSDTYTKLTNVSSLKRCVIEHVPILSDTDQENTKHTNSFSKIFEKNKEDKRKHGDCEEQPNNIRLTKSLFPSSETSHVKKLASFWEGKLLCMHAKSEKTLCDSTNFTDNGKEYNEEVKDNQNRSKFKEILSTVNKLQKLLAEVEKPQKGEELGLLNPLINHMPRQLDKNTIPSTANITSNPFQTFANPCWINDGLGNNMKNIQDVTKNITVIIMDVCREYGVNKNELINEIIDQLNLIDKKSKEIFDKEKNELPRNVHIENKVQTHSKKIYNYLPFTLAIIVLIITIIIVLFMLLYNELLDSVFLNYNKVIMNLYTKIKFF